jgi:SAM-dependent methyltransferase
VAGLTTASAASATCIVCGSTRVHRLFSLDGVPALVGALWPSEAAAREVRTGHMQLASCHDCSHVSNIAFDSDLVDYDLSYENSLHFSPTFQRYAVELAERLVSAYDLHGKTVLEIGSGKGEFLEIICATGGNKGLGYDPTYDGESDAAGLTFVRDLYPLDGTGEHFDFLVCRHVLEHLEAPYELLAGLRRSASSSDVRFYFEVPNGEYTMSAQGQWDIIYPHVSYFTGASLRRLVERSGFEVLRSGTAFDGEFLYVEAAPAAIGTVTVDERVGASIVHAEDFAETYQATVEDWQRRLAPAAVSGAAALWGAGAKGATFLNAVGLDSRVVAVVDVNPRKWGQYVPGTGHRVVAPEELKNHRIDTVVITNGSYRREISERLVELGISADVICV